MPESTRWVVQAYGNGCWQDVLGYGGGNQWPGRTAGDAFHAAVFANESHSISATTYRVLPYTGGISFNVAVDIDPVEHAEAP